MPISPRRAVVELAHYLASHGAAQFGAIHEAVTEGRAHDYASVHSTSCGDLLHAVAFAAGCRSTAINRDEHRGWKTQVNLSRWFVPPYPHQRIWRPKLGQLRPGDFCCYDYTSTRAHGFVFLGMTVEGRALTADFGQPGGRLYECGIETQPVGAMRFRGRPVDCAVPLDSLEFSETPETVTDWLARNGLPLEPWTPAAYFAEL